LCLRAGASALALVLLAGCSGIGGQPGSSKAKGKAGY
jgi:hypothetical protein